MSLEHQSSFQPFDSLPDEVLLLLLDQLTPFQRCLALSICQKWNQTILQRKSWWQYLDVPDHLPFSTALSILQIFNSRSNFTLRHVILQPPLTTSKQVDEVFAELRKSSGHVKVLFLNQSHFMLQARRAAQKFLPRLSTFYCSCTAYPKEMVEFMWQEISEVMVLEEEAGLQFLNILMLEELEPEELVWFSMLKFLNVRFSDSVKDLAVILEIAKTTLRRLTLASWIFDEGLEELGWIPANGFNKIHFPNIKTIRIPNSEASAAALSGLIDVGEQRRRRFPGFVHSLLHFDFPSPREAFVVMYEREDLEEFDLNEEQSKLKTILFFERHPSISHLALVRSASGGVEDRENSNLNFVLQLLSTTRNKEDSKKSKRKSKRVLLPKLQKLSIFNPTALNKKLLSQFWEARRVINKNFGISIITANETFRIHHSGGEEWLDAAEKCE